MYLGLEACFVSSQFLGMNYAFKVKCKLSTSKYTFGLFIQMGSDSKVQEALSIKCYEQLSQETSMNIYCAIFGQHVFCI